MITIWLLEVCLLIDNLSYNYCLTTNTSSRKRFHHLSSDNLKNTVKILGIKKKTFKKEILQLFSFSSEAKHAISDR